MNRELTQKVIEFIGYPPRSVPFKMIEEEFTDNSLKELKDVMDYLWDNDLVQVWKSDWIAGKRPEVKMTLSRDDIDWFLGTGQYSQG